MERNILAITFKMMTTALGHPVMVLALAVALCTGPRFVMAREPAGDARPVVTSPSTQSPVPMPEEGENQDGEGEEGEGGRLLRPASGERRGTHD